MLELLLRFVADDLVLVTARLNLLLQIRGDLTELAGELLVGDVDLLCDDVVTAEGARDGVQIDGDAGGALQLAACDQCCTTRRTCSTLRTAFMGFLGDPL